MKKFLKWLIPCLVACFMVAGLVQTASFTFAEGQDDQTTQTTDSGTNYVLDNPNGNLDDNSGASGGDTIKDSGETGNDETLDENQEVVNVGGAAVFSVYAGRSSDEEDSTEPSVDPNKPDHHKNICGDEESGYSITLDVSGKQQIIPGQKPKIDVVLVIDQSGSMDESMKDADGKGSTRMNVLKKIVTGEKGLTASILGDQKLDARMAVVAYSGDYNNGLYHDATVVSSWTSNYKDDGEFNGASKGSINNDVNGLGADGGTNCEAGLREAAILLNNKRPEAQTYLIFLSDGKPSLYYANGKDYYPFPSKKFQPLKTNQSPPNILGIIWQDLKWENDRWIEINAEEEGWHKVNGEWKYGKYVNSNYTYIEAGTTLGDGNEDASKYPENPDPGVPDGADYGICSSRAYNQATAISGLSGFYTIGVGDDASSDFLKTLPYKTDSIDKHYFSGTSAEELNTAFKNIGESIKNRSLTLHDVVIQDGLSEFVDIKNSINSDGTIKEVKYKITDSTGKDVTKTENESAKMKATYDKKTKTVRCTFAEGYSLKQSHTYSVTFDVEPTQKAYTTYSKNNGVYNINSSDGTNEGFYSNSSATLTYKYGDKEDEDEDTEPITVPYDKKPVIQVSANQLSVTKVVEGKLANKNDEFTFNVDLTNNSETLDKNYSFGSVEIKDKDGNKVNDSTISNQNGKITFKLKDGQTAYLTNLPRNYTFTLKEEPADGYDTTYSTQIVDTKNNAQSATFTYENKDKIFITVTNTAKDIAITGITDNTPKGLGLIGSIVVEIAAISFVLKKKRQLKM